MHLRSAYCGLFTSDSKDSEVKKLKADIDQLGVSAAQALDLGERVKELEAELKTLNKETQNLTEAYQTERVCSAPAISTNYILY